MFFSRQLIDHASAKSLHHNCDDFFLPEEDFESDNSDCQSTAVTSPSFLCKSVLVIPGPSGVARLLPDVSALNEEVADDVADHPLPGFGLPPPPVPVWARVYPDDYSKDPSEDFTVINPAPCDSPHNHKPLEYLKLFFPDSFVCNG
ncbi:hypothetical protein J6590_069794 [Homalodisca vitripennis]|nr:hypothetical protein J6590_069794 [Homalodisca vitripennis]